jgi:glycosyltransferase involved in cell wall biosynthesis
MMAYISFDAVPAPKGAATHIEAFTRALARAFGRIDLVTVSSEPVPPLPVERWPRVFHTELPGLGVSLIDRVLSFRRALEFWLAGRCFDLVQFRSIFEGIPLLRLQPRPRLIFEVNGLPSIELKHRYPRIVDDRELMHKLVSQEQACLRAADRIVTPSAVTARYLSAARGVDAAKIRVIPNGVNSALFRPAGHAPAPGDEINLLYFGTLAAWQGVDLAVRALAQINAQICPQIPASLTVLGVGNHRQQEFLTALAAKLGIADRVHVLPPVGQAQVVEALHHSFAVVAPLAINDRNTKQGCCPLKILEGMAAGVPVIASDLPVVRELGERGKHLLLVKPGSVDQIAQAVLELHADPDLRRRLAENGRAHILGRYTWERSCAALATVCEELGMSLASKA